MDHRIKKKKKLTTKAIVELMILEDYSGVLRHQKLIDEWNDPKDVIQRAAVMLRDVHKIYGRFACTIYRDLVKK